MKDDDKTWTALLDPQYSVLGLPHAPGGNPVRYLDVVTGWQGARRIWPADEHRARRDRLK